MKPALKPRLRRRLRYDLYALAGVMLAPMAVLAVFPFGALHFSPQLSSESHVVCAIVDLSDAEIAAAIKTARSSWQVSVNGVRRLRADLSVAELPEEATGVVLRERPATKSARDIVRYEMPVLPRTMAAAEPAHLEPSVEYPSGGALAFPRDEMLELK